MKKNKRSNIIFLISGLVIVCLVTFVIVKINQTNTPDNTLTNSNNGEINNNHNLTAPINLKYEEDTLFWDAVDGAQRYEINILGKIYNAQNNEYEDSIVVETDECFYDLITVLSPGRPYKTTVTAFDDNNNGKTSNVFMFITASANTGFKFILNEDGKSYTIAIGTVEKKGKIIMPDTYNGLPITNTSTRFGYDYANVTDPSVVVPITYVRLPLGLVTINIQSFSHCAIKKISFPKSVKSIGQNSFLYNRSLEEINFEDGIEEIGQRAFYSTNLKAINLPNSIKTIGNEAFTKTPWYENQPDGVIYFNNRVLYGCKNDLPKNTELVLPESLVYISPYAFSEVKNIKSVTLPSHFESFYGAKKVFFNSGLQEINLPKNFKHIEEYTFSGCENLKNIDLPDSLQGIGNFAFALSGLTTIKLPKNISEYGTYIFQNCKSLISVLFPDNIKVTPPSSLFYGCSSLTNVTFPKNLVKIKASSFFKTSVTEITIPDCVTEIEAKAFASCDKLKLVRLGKGIQVIDSTAFASCSILQTMIIPKDFTHLELAFFSNVGHVFDVFYEGSKEQFEQSEIVVSSLKTLVSADLQELSQYVNVYFYSETQPLHSDVKCWHYVDNEITIW